MKKFCKDLKEHATRIMNYEKKETIPLTKKKKRKHKKQKKCYICNEGLSTDDDNKKYHKARDHCHYTGKYRGAAHNICNLRYKTPGEIPVVFHNGSTYDYHFIIKELAKEFKGEMKCLGKNTEKYITFSVPITKEITNTNKDGNDKITKISYKIMFIVAIDLCINHYQVLLIIYLKDFIVKSVQIINLILITCQSKMIN